MLSEVNIAGIYIAPIVVYAVAALPVAMILRLALWRAGVTQWVWHPALFDLAVYVIVLSLLVLLV